MRDTMVSCIIQLKTNKKKNQHYDIMNAYFYIKALRKFENTGKRYPPLRGPVLARPCLEPSLLLA